MVYDPRPEPAAIGSGGSGNAHHERPCPTFEETLAVWERLGAALAARPADPAGLAELANALSDRLARTGGPAEIAAAAWLADRLGNLAQARPAPPSGGECHPPGAAPVVLGRLCQAARALLGWTQARVAAEAGVSTAVVTALELGRRGPRAATVPAIIGALERGGIRFVAAAAGGLGQGVRYARPAAEREAGGDPGRLPPKTERGHGTPWAGAEGRRLVAESCVARQRVVVARLDAAGSEAELARRLLGETERAQALVRRSRGLVEANSSWSRGTRPAEPVAAAA